MPLIEHMFLKIEQGKASEPTIHDLFNELHRRLMAEGEHCIGNSIDSLHHEYVDNPATPS